MKKKEVDPKAKLFEALGVLFCAIMDCVDYQGKVTDEYCAHFRASTAILHIIFREFTEHLIQDLRMKVEDAEKWMK